MKKVSSDFTGFGGVIGFSDDRDFEIRWEVGRLVQTEDGSGQSRSISRMIVAVTGISFVPQATRKGMEGDPGAHAELPNVIDIPRCLRIKKD
jgi:hypothetical protein